MGRTRRTRNGGAEGRPRTQHPLKPGMPFVVSEHAIIRFRERIAPLQSFLRARHEVEFLASTSKKTEDRTPGGEEVWEASDGAPIRFIVRRDHRGPAVCVSVLAPRHAGEDEVPL